MNALKIFLVVVVLASAVSARVIIPHDEIADQNQWDEIIDDQYDENDVELMESFEEFMSVDLAPEYFSGVESTTTQRSSSKPPHPTHPRPSKPRPTESKPPGPPPSKPPHPSPSKPPRPTESKPPHPPPSKPPRPTESKPPHPPPSKPPRPTPPKPDHSGPNQPSSGERPSSPKPLPVSSEPSPVTVVE